MCRTHLSQKNQKIIKGPRNLSLTQIALRRNYSSSYTSILEELSPLTSAVPMDHDTAGLAFFAIISILLGLVIIMIIWRVLTGCARATMAILKINEAPPPRRRMMMEYDNPSCRPMYAAGYCTRCQAATRCAWHCHGCGANSGSPATIVVNYFHDGKDPYVCTQCFLVPRLPHHCDRCGGRARIIALRQ